jgi:tetratricopeptide (TPR) repeat protein
MKIWLPLYSLLIMMVVYGCKNSDKEHPEKILQQPPYKDLTDSIQQFPDNAGLYLERAILLSQHNRHELATSDYKKLWELNPAPPVALQYVSNLMLVNKPQEAIALLKDCQKKWPDYGDLHRRLSEIYDQTGQTQKAIQEFDEWVQQDSLNFEAWYEKGLMMAKLKDTPAAIQAMERSYFLQPINYNGLALASLYAATLNPKVITICDALLAKDTTANINDVMYVKGTYYSDTKQYDKARSLFDECISRDWKFTDAYIEKGIILYEQKKFDSALNVFTMAVTVANSNPDAYFWLARGYEALGKRDEALLNYQRAVAIDRSFDEAREGIRRLKK